LFVGVRHSQKGVGLGDGEAEGDGDGDGEGDSAGPVGATVADGCGVRVGDGLAVGAAVGDAVGEAVGGAIVGVGVLIEPGVGSASICAVAEDVRFSVWVPPKNGDRMGVTRTNVPRIVAVAVLPSVFVMLEQAVTADPAWHDSSTSVGATVTKLPLDSRTARQTTRFGSGLAATAGHGWLAWYECGVWAA
jgi:hypothetical protein